MLLLVAKLLRGVSATAGKISRVTALAAHLLTAPPRDFDPLEDEPYLRRPEVQ